MSNHGASPEPEARDQIAAAGGELAEDAYRELRALAASKLQAESGPITLRATALAHEAYLRLVDQRVRFESVDHFLALAARAMRRILVDQARRRALRRDRGTVHLDILADEGEEDAAAGALDLLDLDRALLRLAERDPRKARVVELRFFGGLSLEAVGRELGIARRTAGDDWAFARAWLHRELRAQE